MGHFKLRNVPQGTMPRDLALGIRMRKVEPAPESVPELVVCIPTLQVVFNSADLTGGYYWLFDVTGDACGLGIVADFSQGATNFVTQPTVQNIGGGQIKVGPLNIDTPCGQVVGTLYLGEILPSRILTGASAVFTNYNVWAISGGSSGYTEGESESVDSTIDSTLTIAPGPDSCPFAQFGLWFEVDSYNPAGGNAPSISPGGFPEECSVSILAADIFDAAQYNVQIQAYYKDGFGAPDYGSPYGNPITITAF